MLLWQQAFAGTRDTAISLQSTHLGEGRIRYTIITPDDPFYSFLDVTGFGLWDTNSFEWESRPPRWTNGAPAMNGWYFDGDGLGGQVRPYQASFVIRSALTSFKQVEYGALVLMSIGTVGGYHGHVVSVNVVGYWNARVLVPCPPEEADGSETNLTSTLKLFTLPDIQIASLILSNGRPAGISYSYPELNTVRLEATYDFNIWTNVAYIYGQSGTTTWINADPLDSYGNNYRVRLVAEGHAPNLPPLNPGTSMLTAAGSNPAKDTPPSKLRSLLERSRPDPDGTEVAFASEPGRAYSVMLLDLSMNPMTEVEVLATRSATSVLLRGAASRAGLIKITELSKP